MYPDLGPYCLQYRLPKNISRQEERTTKVMTGGYRLTAIIQSLSRNALKHRTSKLCSLHSAIIKIQTVNLSDCSRRQICDTQFSG